MENEIWKDITGYEGLYQVSNMGRVRSTNRTIELAGGGKRTLPGKILRPSVQKGYRRVTLSEKGIETTFLIHRLVVDTFVGPITDGMEVDHINEDHGDNRAENLRLLSRFDNASRSTRGTFRKKSNAMENNPRRKRVIGYIDGVEHETLPCAKYISERYGINYSTVRRHLQLGGLEVGKITYRYETTT